MKAVGAALRELVELYSRLGGGPGSGTRGPDRRGPAHVLVQVLAIAALAAAWLVVVMVLRGTSGGPLVWPLEGLALLVPAVLHAAARPARRAAGTAAGLVTAALVLVASWAFGVFAAASFWPGFAAVALAAAVGSVVFAAVAPVRRAPGSGSAGGEVGN